MRQLTATVPYPLFRLIEAGELTARDFERRALRTSRELDRIERRAIIDTKAALRQLDREIRDAIIEKSDATQLGQSNIYKIIDDKVNEFRDRRRHVMQRATMDAVDAAQKYRQGISAIAKQPAPTAPIPHTLAQDILTVQDESNRGFADDLRARIKREVTDGVAKGKTPRQIAGEMVQKRIVTPQVKKRPVAGDTVTTGAKAQAERLSRTEVRQAFNAANFAQGRAEHRALPGTLKAWLSQKDAAVRETHLIAEREYGVGGSPGPIPMHRKFKVGNAKLRFPCDPAGPPEEIINCRCVLVEIVPDVAGKIEQEPEPFPFQ